MRRARPLFLLAILGISGFVAYTYRARMEEIRRRAPKAPPKLPPKVGAALQNWFWQKSAGNGAAVEVTAKNMRHDQEKNLFELEGMTMKIFHKDGKTFDHVTSERADFNLGESYLYADGDANIQLGLAEGEEPAPGRIIQIKASGVRFDMSATKAATEREVQFGFERGEGRATGATYDPNTRELHLKSNAQLTWHDKSATPRPMRVEAGEVVYRESDSKVLLSPWSKFSRGTMTLEGASATVTLDTNGIRLVETTNARGADNDPQRKLDYSADKLVMFLSERSEIERIRAESNARLVATSSTAVTETRSDAVDLDFDVTGGDSILTRALATGKSLVESKPVAQTGRRMPETRVLRSEVIELKMREGGKEIAALETQTPGVLEFFPNSAGQRKRRVEGDRFFVTYGDNNRLESFKAVQVTTRTENEERKGKPSPPALTWSKELEARFSPSTGDMTRLEQWGDFRYEEGDRKAQGDRGILESATSLITLIDHARVSDTTGSTAADRIVLDQRTEDFRAEGNVTSSRLPDKKGGGAAMLSQEEPLQARARIMSTFEGRTNVVYEGGAVLWQGSSRLTADRIEIDRANSALRATGNVVSTLQEKRKGQKKTAPPVFTVIQSASLVYTDKQRLAHYAGGAKLKRAALDVTAREIRAFMKEQKPDGDSGLDKAIADGDVIILSAAGGRTRRGTSGHAEYYTEDGKVVLEQDQPMLEDSLRGVTRGTQLIYFANDDRLLVNGVASKPSVSKVRRRK
ncbi:MAG: LPS export ABC transporter periplasmic protein LptC [Bryobacteraceae bacterium]|nr:LPS export ABC transporter periplasmic protein LptC [Bryobacteraceae bacterium]